jgi:hypothetical protein
MNLTQNELAILEALSHRFTTVPEIVEYIWPETEEGPNQNWRYINSIKTTLERLESYKLVVQVGSGWALTQDGEKELSAR